MKPPMVTEWFLGGTRLSITVKGVESGTTGDSRVSYYKTPFSRLYTYESVAYSFHNSWVLAF
jgi:hypothetical protein